MAVAGEPGVRERARHGVDRERPVARIGDRLRQVVGAVETARELHVADLLREAACVVEELDDVPRHGERREHVEAVSVGSAAEVHLIRVRRRHRDRDRGDHGRLRSCRGGECERQRDGADECDGRKPSTATACRAVLHLPPPSSSVSALTAASGRAQRTPRVPLRLESSAPACGRIEQATASRTRAKRVKTLDFRTERHDNPGVAGTRPLRRAAHEDDVRARAEAATRAGSPAAALALMTAAADDVERDDPLEAAVLLAEASWYAQLAHGPTRALQVAHRAADLAAEADGDVALIVHSRLGDALQWNGRYMDAQREWLRAATARTAADANLLVARTDVLLRAGELAAAHESAYAAAARAREAGDAASLRDALTYQVISEIHLGLLREADASASELLSAAGAATSGDRLEALGVHAWVDALLGSEESCRFRIAAAEATAAELGVTPSAGKGPRPPAPPPGRGGEAGYGPRGELFRRPPPG